MTFWGEPNAAVNYVGPLFLNSYHRIWYLSFAPKTLWLMLAIGPTGRLAFFIALLHFLRGLANQTSLQWWSSWGLVSQIWLSSTVMVCGTDPDVAVTRDSRHSGIQCKVTSRGVWSMRWSVGNFLDNSVKHQLPSSCSNYVAFTFETQGLWSWLETHPSTKRAWGRFVWSLF